MKKNAYFNGLNPLVTIANKVSMFFTVATHTVFCSTPRFYFLRR